MPDTPIPWNQLKPGNRYRIAFRGSDSIGTFRKLLWSNPRQAEVLFDQQAPWAGPKMTMPVRLTMYTDVTQGVQVYPTFGEKLALLNTKLGADPGILSEIMKFNTSNFKPGPWTEMTKAQSAVSAAKARKEETAMKTGGRGTRRRRRRRSTRRRL
jgi:hypothetical protein